MIIIEVVWAEKHGFKTSILHRAPELVNECVDYYRSLLGSEVHSVRVVS